MGRDRETEVLVVGGGPVGLFAALSLAERDVPVVVAEKYHRTALHSYALALHPRTLEMLDDFGLALELIEIGQRVDRIAVHFGTEGSHELDLSRTESRFPFILVLPQVLLEGALEARLEDKGVEVLWGHSALSIDLDGPHASTLIAHTDETPSAKGERVEISASRIRSTFVIGADGYDSTVRRTLGLEYRDLGCAMGYALLEYEGPVERCDTLNLVFHEETTDVLWPIAAERGRWNLQIDNPEFVPGVEDLTKLIRARAPWFGTELDRIHWHTTTAFERRLVDRFGRGRAWLVGDAAHLTSPVGAQSMNIGLREAYELTRILASILNRGAPPELLDGHDAERCREWRRHLLLDAAPEISSDAPDRVRGIASRLVSSLPASGDDLQALLAQVGIGFAEEPAVRKK